jgi:hypothetical protein
MPTMQEAKAQRAHMYARIHDILQVCNFDLILRVHQLSAAVAANIRNVEKSGFCHGFAQYWQDCLLAQDHTSFKPKYPEFLPLSPTIKSLQGKQPLKYKLQKKFYFSSFATCNAMLDHLVTKFIANNFHHGDMLVFAIAAAPRPMCIAPAPMLQSSAFSTREWHEVRFHCDKDGYMHWFDANVGWFKCGSPDLNEDSINGFLKMLFAAMQYDQFTAVTLCAATNLLRNTAKPKLWL